MLSVSGGGAWGESEGGRARGVIMMRVYTAGLCWGVDCCSSVAEPLYI